MLQRHRRLFPALARTRARRHRSAWLTSLHVAGAGMAVVLATQDSPAASHLPAAVPGSATLIVALPLPESAASLHRHFFTPDPAQPRTYSMRLPLDAIEVTSGFGRRTDPFRRRAAFHNGIDFAAAPGTSVHATADGIVMRATYSKDYGNLVLIDHGDGCSTLYAHNQRLLVRAGEPILAGQPIALVGSSGRSTGPHLHFEVRRDGIRVDPKDYVAGL